MKVVVLHSGGLDSSTLLFKMLAEGHSVLPLSVDYGQRHAVELRAAKEIVEYASSEFPGQVEDSVTAPIHLPRSILGGSSQTGCVEVPKGHYEDESMRATVVPNRNMIMLSVAAAAAITWGAEGVAYAAHSGDHAIYPDCRPDFALWMSKALETCHYEPGIKLITPYLNQNKGAVVADGYGLGVPLELTYSCYEGRDIHCGECGTCVERKEAFEQAGVRDPTIYGQAPTV